MVRLSLCLLKQRRTFIDSVRISACGGRGGNGLPKYGGVGGKGGDVYIEAHDSYSLKKLKQEYPDHRFTAGKGSDSKRFMILGSPGKDCIIKCPVGVSAITDSKQVLGGVDRDGDRLLIAKGGCGGGPQNNYLGQKGQSLPLVLDLKLLADVGFVGFPNAGKSTLLKALSNAKPKIASYPFTTIEPNIGILKYPDFREISAADLPGLIEGAHVNHGMGHKFLKHCLRTKILLFVVDIDGFRLNPNSPFRDAFETIMFLNRELELYDEELVYKPTILAINKFDTDSDGNKFRKLKDQLEAHSKGAIKLLEEMRPNSVINFDTIVPISAKHGTNISLLKDKIRTIIDITQEEKMRKMSEDCRIVKKDLDIIYV